MSIIFSVWDPGSREVTKMCRGQALKPAIHNSCNLLQWRSVKMERKVSRKKRVKSKEVDFKKLFRVSEGPAFVKSMKCLT